MCIELWVEPGSAYLWLLKVLEKCPEVVIMRKLIEIVDVLADVHIADPDRTKAGRTVNVGNQTLKGGRLGGGEA